MAATCIFDAFGRAFWSGVAPGSTCTKNGIPAVNSDGTPVVIASDGTWVDNRPQKNYRELVFSSGDFSGGNLTNHVINCVEFGLVFYFQSANLDWNVTLDGVTTRVNPSLATARQSEDGQILWGKSGLTPGNHTISVTDNTSYVQPSAFLKGVWYSDLSVDYGQPITYAFSDGQSVTVSPTVDKAGAVQSMVDRWVAGYTTGTNASDFLNSFITGNDCYIMETISSLAGAYAMTGDSRLPSLAAGMLNRWNAQVDITTGLWTGNSQAADLISILTNGRLAHNFWYAWRVFGDSRYLTAADKVTGAFRNSWPVNGSNVWGDNYNGAWGNALPGNQYLSACLSAAVMYNEPASQWYQDATLRTKLLATASAATAGQINSDGSIKYALYGEGTEPDRLYAIFEYLPLMYLMANFGFTQTNLDAVAGWLNGIGPGEPFEWQGIVYGGMPPWALIARMLTDPSCPTDYSNDQFSAAFDSPNPPGGNDTLGLDYNPAGFPASSAAYTGTFDQISGMIFYAVQYFQMLGVALPVTAPVAVSTALAALSQTGTATLLLPPLAGVQSATMGTLSLAASCTLCLPVLLASGSAALRMLTLQASATLNLGLLQGTALGNPIRAPSIGPLTIRNLSGQPLTLRVYRA